MKAIIFLLVLLFLLQATFSADAANWQLDLDINDQLRIDEIIQFENDVLVISHYALPPDPMLQDAPTIYRYYFNKFDENGNQLDSKSYDLFLIYQGYVLNDENEIITFWQDFYPLIIENGLHLFSLEDGVLMAHLGSIDFSFLNNFNSFSYYNGNYYAAGISNYDNALSVLAINAAYDLTWHKMFSEFPVYNFGGSPNVIVNDKGINLLYNTNVLPAIANSTLDYSSILLQLKTDGEINWSKNIYYEPLNWSYYGIQMHEFVKSNSNYVWVITTVSPGCDEGCPYNVLYQIDGQGNIVAAKRMQTSFYGSISKGFTLPNGNIVLHGTASDDIFGGGNTFVKSIIAELNTELQIIESYKANEIDNQYLGYQYDAVFQNATAAINQKIFYNWNEQIIKTDLSLNECNNLEEDDMTVINEQGWLEDTLELSSNVGNSTNSTINFFEFLVTDDQNTYTRTCVNDTTSVINSIINIDDLFFEVYPNPIQNEINIKGIIHNDFTVHIYDATGKLLLQQNNSRSLQLNNEIVEGVLILQLVYKGKKFFKKLIKQ